VDYVTDHCLRRGKEVWEIAVMKLQGHCRALCNGTTAEWSVVLLPVFPAALLPLQLLGLGTATGWSAGVQASISYRLGVRSATTGAWHPIAFATYAHPAECSRCTIEEPAAGCAHTTIFELLPRRLLMIWQIEQKGKARGGRGSTMQWSYA
jgi:hypothetical protein